MTEAEYRGLNLIEEWRKVGSDALTAASVCREVGSYRSAVSRSYYAAYSFVASRLVAYGLDFRDDRVGPEHEPIPDLIKNHLARTLGQKTVWEVRARVQRLYLARLRADYLPHFSVSPDLALEAERDARFIQIALGG